MKRVILFLLFLIMPMVSWASDHCTHPDLYTIDKRCYVTDEQKKESPYNAVVGLVDSYGVYCTGTIVRQNGKLWIYTAKHCAGDENNVVQSELAVNLQDGRILDVTKNNVGNHSLKYDIFFRGDWAIYHLNVSDAPSVEITDKKRRGVGPLTHSYNARVVGYGALKIMSDKEIEDFKQRYITWLKDEQGVNVSWVNKTMYGIFGDGIDLYNAYAEAFENQLEYKYWEDLFDDDKLKVSNCKYSSNGKQINCQTWRSNSGGPIFDDKNTIMGIHTRGNRMIGGENHASDENPWFEPFSYSIPLLR